MVSVSDAGDASSAAWRCRAGAAFASTSRWLRGRILDQLRDVPDDEWGAVAGPIGEHEDMAVDTALLAMESEGLIERDRHDPVESDWPGSAVRQSVPKRDAAEARLNVEDRLEAGRARPFGDSLGQRQVRAAHERPMRIGQGVEGAIAKADRAEAVRDRLVPAALERADEPGAARARSAAHAEDRRRPISRAAWRSSSGGRRHRSARVRRRTGLRRSRSGAPGR